MCIRDSLSSSKIEFKPRISFNYRLGFPGFKVISPKLTLREILSEISEESFLITAVKDGRLNKDLNSVPNKILIVGPKSCLGKK